MEARGQGLMRRRFIFKDFALGFIAGFVVTAIVFGVVAGMVYFRNKDREEIHYVKKQIEIEALREDYVNRDFGEFLDAVPDVRGAADGAAAEFERKRDEALQRFRGGYFDRRDFGGGLRSD